MSNLIYLIANNAAVDAVMITKAQAIDGIRNKHGFSLEQVATVGDEIVDIPMLEIAGLGRIGTVANAQQRVIKFVQSKRQGYVSNQRVYDGFRDFYDVCKQQGIRLIVTDKDGVLKDGGDVHWGGEYAKLALVMGLDGNPISTILTGSGLKDNIKFMKQYGLDKRLEQNIVLKENPYLLLAENGAIHVNVITGETQNYCSELDRELLTALKGPFETEVAKRIQNEVLPEFGFVIGYDHDKQKGIVYHNIEKQAGVTFNVPREDNSGAPFRKTPEAQMLREREIDIMQQVADGLGIPYQVL
ncbi:MAG: HAD hydrolase family protein [Candidatus Nanoarchaeia archaeon]|nr:HAD hydrolase family protein [Candidatus Nanoarchaeia archaeon]